MEAPLFPTWYSQATFSCVIEPGSGPVMDVTRTMEGRDYRVVAFPGDSALESSHEVWSRTFDGCCGSRPCRPDSQV